MKSIILRCKQRGENLLHAISAWCYMTWADSTSPAQLFFGRRKRQALPILAESLIQSEMDPSQIMPDFAWSDYVWMQHHLTKKWHKQVIIIEIRHDGRAYEVKDDTGSTYIRGRHFLCACSTSVSTATFHRIYSSISPVNSLNFIHHAQIKNFSHQLPISSTTCHYRLPSKT